MSPDGSADVSTRRTKPGLARSLLGASDRMNDGMPMVNHAAMVTWMGWNGYNRGSTPRGLANRHSMPTNSARSTEYTVLVRKRLATRSMLPITRRPSPTTYGSVANLLSSRMIHRHLTGTQQQNPQPLGPDLLRPFGDRRRRIQQHVGRADHPVAVIAEGHAAPLGGRLERRGGGRDPAGWPVIGFSDRQHAGIGSGVGRGQRGEHVGDGCGLPDQVLDLGNTHTAFGQRAGLVGTNHVDPRQPLDGGQFLHQALALTQPDDPDRESDRRQQDQAFGHHGHQRTDRPQYGLPPSRVRGEKLRVDGQQTRRYQ